MIDVARAVDAQRSLVQMHIARVRDRRDRYACPSMAWSATDMELSVWIEINQMLQALSLGKTVPPS